jgi:eukaryotic-like serine/threonine-protein kinase
MAEPDRFVGKLLAGTYQVGRLIGKGGMGAIYEATHARLQGKRYAIKVLAPKLTDEPELLMRFRREAEIASQLGHDNIVAVHDFNIADGQAYMVMELLEGEDLAARLRTRGALSVDEVKRILDQVVSALDATHRAQIVHRDLKPANIFLCRRAGHHDHVKVLDFGVSKMLDSSSVMTLDHALIGTPFYMSPEQADGRVKEIDARTDVFALGAIIWEMLTGSMAFAAPTLTAALYKVCSVDPPDVHFVRNDVPPAVSLVLRRALAKERHQRTPSVGQVAAELAAALHGVIPAGLPPPASGGQASVSGFVAPSHGARSLAVAGTAVAAAPQPQPVWANPIAAPPMAPPGGAFAPAPGVPGLPTVASYPGTPFSATSAHSAGLAAGWPAAEPDRSVASSSVVHSAAPGAGSLAVGSVLVQRRSSRGLVAAVAGAVVLGLGIWGVTLRGSSGPATAPVSPSGPAFAPVSPSGPGLGSAAIAKPAGPGGDAAPAGAAAGPLTPPAEVALFVTVEPADARPKIILGDKKVTEHLLHVPRSDTPVTLTAEAAGFVTYHGDVLPDHDQRVAIVLKRKGAKATAAAPTPARPSPRAAATRTPVEPPADAAKRAEPTLSSADAVRAAPGPATPGSQPGSASSPTTAPAQPAAVAGNPSAGGRAGAPAPGAVQAPTTQPRPVPLPPPRPVPLPPPPAEPKKTGTIFDQ